MLKFEGICWRCHTRITSRDGGGTWRHDKAPADKHQGSASGVIKQI